MTEYIMFDAGLCRRFVDFLAARGIQNEVRPDAIEGFVVALADDPADDIEEAIEEAYQALMAEQVGLTEAAVGGAARALMRVNATLADGSALVVQLPAVQARRLAEHFTMEEIHQLVSAIAQSVLNPVDGPMCRQPLAASAPGAGP